MKVSRRDSSDKFSGIEYGNQSAKSIYGTDAVFSDFLKAHRPSLATR